MSTQPYVRAKTVLADKAARGLLRSRVITRKQTSTTVTTQGKTLLQFSSNDYLNLTTHPKIKNAFAESAMTHGLGSGASALISGHTEAHQTLEDKMARFLNRERALLFNSGYHANLAVMTTLAHRKSIIIADKYCHASLIDGMVLSRAKCLRYRHQDIAQVHSLLEQQQANSPLLVTESIFSMQGDLTDLPQLAALSRAFDATLIVDDAHALGVLGAQGKGSCEHFQLSSQDVPCLITPLGKALGGFGAVVSGNNDFIELLLQSARTYRYTTALPPALCDAMVIALTILEEEGWRRERLHTLITFFIEEAIKLNLPLLSKDHTPIKSLLMKSNQHALALQQILFQQGFLVSCIRAPTVPKNIPLLRISLSCAHSEENILQLLNTLAEHYAS